MVVTLRISSLSAQVRMRCLLLKGFVDKGINSAKVKTWTDLKRRKLNVCKRYVICQQKLDRSRGSLAATPSRGRIGHRFNKFTPESRWFLPAGLLNSKISRGFKQMSSVPVPKKHPTSSNIYKLPVETVKPGNKATNSPSSGCKKLSDVVVYEGIRSICLWQHGLSWETKSALVAWRWYKPHGIAFCWWGHWSLLHCFTNSLRGTEASAWKGKPHFNSYKATNAGRLCHQSEKKAYQSGGWSSQISVVIPKLWPHISNIFTVPEQLQDKIPLPAPKGGRKYSKRLMFYRRKESNLYMFNVVGLQTNK